MIDQYDRAVLINLTAADEPVYIACNGDWYRVACVTHGSRHLRAYKLSRRGVHIGTFRSTYGRDALQELFAYFEEVAA